MNRPTNIAITNQIAFIVGVASLYDSARTLAEKTGLSIYVVERRIARVKRWLKARGLSSHRTSFGTSAGCIIRMFEQESKR